MTVLLPRDRKYSRYLFDWSARWCLERGGALDTITGQAATFARAATGSATDSSGASYTAPVDQPRWSWVDLDGDTVRESVALNLGADDGLTFGYLGLPRALTVYCRFIEGGTAGGGGTNGLFAIGGSTNAALFVANNGSNVYRLTHRRASDVHSAQAAAPTSGDLVELRAILHADGSVQLGQSINGAAETLAAASAANALATTWNAATIWFNERSGSKGASSFVQFRIAAGLQTLAYLREG